MGATATLIKLLESFSEEEFYKVAMDYLNFVELIKSPALVNGPYDSGIDLVAVKESSDAQYQCTTTKLSSFEKKIHSDLTQAQANIQDFGLPKRVFYFYSQELSNTRILELEKIAVDVFKLKLTLLDAKRIAAAADVYTDVARRIIALSEIQKYDATSDFFDRDKTKSYFELITHGSPRDVKYNVIVSQLTFTLSQKEAFSVQGLFDSLKDVLGVSMSETYYDQLLHKMRSDRIIEVDTETQIVSLTERERERVKQALDQYQAENVLFQKTLAAVLDKHGVTVDLTELIEQMMLLFESSYNINVTELIGQDGDVADVVNATRRFEEWLRRITAKPKKVFDVHVLTGDLMDACNGFDVLKKVAAGKVISRYGEPERLQEYYTRNVSNIEVFLDTNVLIPLACASYKDDSTYEDYYYRTAGQFSKFSREEGLILKTSRYYARELGQQLRDAVYIAEFASLPIFQKLGGTKNKLYQFYAELKIRGELPRGTVSFTDFLAEFKLKRQANVEYTFREETEYLLGVLNVAIEDIDGYEITDTKRMIEFDAMANHGRKSRFAISNDAIMIERLSDVNMEVNPREPILCSWDLSLFRVRREYFKRRLSCTRWHLYTPSKLMDHFAMMKLRIRPSAVANEVMAIAGGRVDLTGESRSLIDSIATIINPSNEIGLRYSNRLAEMRLEKVLRVGEDGDGSGERGIEVPALEILFHEFYVHYIHNDDEKVARQFRQLFTKEEMFTSVLDVIEREVESISKKGKVSTDVVTDIDALLLRMSKKTT
ncbi:MAG: hypothetical protein JNN32_06535 [Flavobacteriales bacterium]|nr:hypothetical protein [Flavobacteriales bacterium]